MSLDATAPDFVRAAIEKELKRLGRRSVGSDVVDQAMSRIGISDGGQLKALTHTQLAQETGAERLLYTEIEEFAFQSGIVLARRVVIVDLRLVDGETGQTLSESTGRGVTSKVGADAATETVLNVTGKAVRDVPGAETVTDTKLARETRLAVRRALKRLP